MASNPSRVDMLLGISSQPVASTAYEANELSEEDVWGSNSDARALPDESTSPVSEVIKHNLVSFGVGISGTKTVVDLDPYRFVTNSRRWLGREKDSGLSAAYEDGGRSRGFPGPLNQGVVASNVAFPSLNPTPGRTASRLISSRDFSSSRSGISMSSSKVLHQSAPVNVPDWSKLLGTEKKDKGFVDDDVVTENDEDDERLPPHELIAKEFARSQVATFSMTQGAGRTLKGRDLSRVRTAVLRQTGFLNDQ